MQSCIIAVLLLGLALHTAGAQPSAGTITGIVADSSGASIAGCEVLITNSDTGVARRTRTNAEGVFVAPGLISGPYQVEMQASGFRRKLFRRVVLQLGQELRLDTTLELGPVAESVDVTAEISPLQQETAEVSDTFTTDQVRDMPLNSRNPLGILDLAAGVTAAGDDPSKLGYDSYATFNGSQALGNSFQIDGASVQHVTGWVESVGSIESISEFKVLSHTYSAEFGRTSGGVVTFAVRSGTNKLHGSAYEYQRNTRFNANNWASNARGIEEPTRSRNEFGATLGGPVPGMKRKLFYFASYEGQVDNAPVTFTRTIPELTLRGGDFSATPVVVKDPLSGQPFAGNAIPASRLDPAAVKLMSLFPAPNTEGTLAARYGIHTSNWVRAAANRLFFNYGIMRLDYNATNKDKLFLTFSHINEDRDWAQDFESPINSQASPAWRNMRRATFSYSRFVRPHLMNELILTAQRDPLKDLPRYAGYDVTKELGIQRRVGDSIPNITLSGGYGTYGNSKERRHINQPIGLSDAVTWVRGRHTMKFGAQIYQTQYWYHGTELSDNSGSYTFTGEVTGGLNNPVNSLADLLSGNVKTALVRVLQIPVNRMNYAAGVFFNDTWKVTRRLTLNLGLRQDMETRQIIKNDVYSRVDPGTGDLLVPGRNASRNLNLSTHWNSVAPRFGTAYSLGDKTVIRTGVALFYSTFWVNNGTLVTYPGWTVSQAFPDQGLGKAQPFTFSQGFPVESVTGVSDPLEVFRSATPQKPLTVESVTYRQSEGLPRSLQWNFGIQRKLPFRSVIETAYVASRADRLARSTPGNSPTLDRAPEAVIQRKPIQQLRPFSNVGAFNVVSYDGTADYHSLQIKVNRRFSGGFSVNANFTFSKNMDSFSNYQGSYQIPWQFPEIEHALSTLDRTRMLTIGWLWRLPFGKGQPLFGGNRLFSAVLGGFQFNGIMKANDGMPLTIRQSNTNTILSAQRPDVIDPSNLSGRVAEPAFLGANRVWLIEPGSPGFPFQPSSNVGIGNLGRNTTRAPGSLNFNLSLFREFRATDTVKLQLRVEAFNAMNHVNFLRPDVNISNAAFGRISNASPARQLQLGLRMSF
ncbi:MAG: carboxypeptidase regulatory-like domain-containing protein [Acidobacteria bacterium]|nr:carboxypeptidase regulatory-like domain-containing protein [Acidobacteriota bacterium]